MDGDDTGPGTGQNEKCPGRSMEVAIHHHISIINDPLAHIINDHHLLMEADAMEAADETKGIKKLLYG